MENVEKTSGVPVRMLGKTGVRVSVLGLGGYHIGKTSDPEIGIRIIRTAVDEGINLLDNAWCYHEGRSEEIIHEGEPGSISRKKKKSIFWSGQLPQHARAILSGIRRPDAVSCTQIHGEELKEEK